MSLGWEGNGRADRRGGRPCACETINNQMYSVFRPLSPVADFSVVSVWKNQKNGRSNGHRNSKKCKNDHRIGGQFRVFGNAHHWKIRHSSVYGLLFPDWPCHTWSWRHAPVSREHKVTRKFVWFGHPEGFSIEYLPILSSPKILGVLRSSASSTTSTAGSTTSSSRTPRQKEQQEIMEMEMAKRTSRKPFPSTTRTATASWAWTSSKRWWANSGVPTRSFQFWSLRSNLCQNISFGVGKVCTSFTKPFIQTTYEVALEAVVHSARLGDIKGCVKIK